MSYSVSVTVTRADVTSVSLDSAPLSDMTYRGRKTMKCWERGEREGGEPGGERRERGGQHNTELH